MQVFDRLLIDADWSVNTANWMWLSCSGFFFQYYRSVTNDIAIVSAHK